MEFRAVWGSGVVLYSWNPDGFGCREICFFFSNLKIFDVSFVWVLRCGDFGAANLVFISDRFSISMRAQFRFQSGVNCSRPEICSIYNPIAALKSGRFRLYFGCLGNWFSWFTVSIILLTRHFCWWLLLKLVWSSCIWLNFCDEFGFASLDSEIRTGYLFHFGAVFNPKISTLIHF